MSGALLILLVVAFALSVASSRQRRPTIAGSHPLPGSRVTSRYGVDRGHYRHSGTDFAAGGEIVRAAHDGIVGRVWFGSAGWSVSILDRTDHWRTWYFHLAQEPTVKAGQRVRAGDPLGIEGNTGNSRGVHLHFEVHDLSIRGPHDPNPARVDPEVWLAAALANTDGAVA